jgi:hypothetical protein
MRPRRGGVDDARRLTQAEEMRDVGFGRTHRAAENMREPALIVLRQLRRHHRGETGIEAQAHQPLAPRPRRHSDAAVVAHGNGSDIGAETVARAEHLDDAQPGVLGELVEARGRAFRRIGLGVEP